MSISQSHTPWRTFFGLDSGGNASHREKIVSMFGACLAICGVFDLAHLVLGTQGAALMVASMGASAVLLFAVPHGPLSQPWPLIGGHLISALIGVSCARWLGSSILGAGAAVGLAVGAMYYLRCIHPPGGATALTAVVGGEAVHRLGYGFVVAPVLLNVAIIFAIALLFNFPFVWRRYPAYWSRLAQRQASAGRPSPSVIEHGDFVYALSQLDSFVDVNEDDLLRIYTLATGRAQHRHLMPAQIALWHVYADGDPDGGGEVRDIIDEQQSPDSDKDQVIYRVLAGPNRRDTGVMTRAEFARWAKYEVVREGKRWVRADTPA